LAILITPSFEFKGVEFGAVEIGEESSPSEASEGMVGHLMGRIEGVPVLRSLKGPHGRETWCIISAVRPRRVDEA
jgi:hypothetical protein